MAHAYTPGLQVKDEILYRVQRLLPIPGEVLVREGDEVTADTVVARSEQPGDIFPINLANQLGVSPSEVPGVMHFQVGDKIEEGDLLATSKGIFGFFKNSRNSPYTGTIESISHVTGQVIIRGEPIPVQVDAFVAGKVVEVLPQEGVDIETKAAFVQGIFGIGGEIQGPLVIVTEAADQDLTSDLVLPEHRGAILVAGRRIQGEAVKQAQEMGVHAIIGGGIDDHDLKEVLGYDLGVAITGSESIGLTIIITEGFGEIAMAEHTFGLLQHNAGALTSVNGATQIRAGVLRPEIVIPTEGALNSDETAQRVGGGVLEVGSHVRLIRDPYFGRLGRVAELPTEPHILDSGSKARVLVVDCETGGQVTVPRANVELVGDQ
ncbi:hypothetical protein KOR42_43110 [Thalassoglobus neptunius]|uniref:Uncharacterized protein n=1 Tax=Thalassoglobus neptunius TaxID=1938619 RepID=A0A5C5W901_9PLAN|nr:hypothetical protein [Thalassoglobus neptunius]TWT46967.1 hypothetical protein KOR42_43110 [Thalassoglobus neptunius]